MIAWLIAHAASLAANPMFSGIVAASAVGAVAWALREVPMAIGRKIAEMVSREVIIYNDSQSFEWVEKWLANHPYTQSFFCRRLRLTIEPSDSIEHDDYDKVLAPGHGYHLMFYKGWPVILYRHMEENSSASMWTNKRVERFDLRILFGPRRVLMQMIEEAEANAKMQRGKVPLYVWTSGWWTKAPPLRPRSLDHVYLPGNALNAFIEDADNFVRKADWYVERGVPYRRGYLLAGPPGTGKSTLAIALASHLKRPVYVISLSGVSDTELAAASMSVPRNALLLLEDADTVQQTADREKQNQKPSSKSDRPGPPDDDKPRLTLGGLLNALDGVFASEGRILVMTTNYPEKLDAALVRSGRVDYRLDFDHADEKVLADMFNVFYQAHFTPDYFEGMGGMTPADVQNVLLSNPDEPVLAMEAIRIHQLTHEQKEAA